MIIDQNHLDLETRIGECSVCGKRGIEVKPTIWNFPYIECQCHNAAGHNKKKLVCKDCKAVTPRSTTVHFDTHVLSAINTLIMNHENEYRELLKEHKSYYEEEVPK